MYGALAPNGGRLLPPVWGGLKFSHVGAILIVLVAPNLASVKCDVQPLSRHSQAVGSMSYVVGALETRTASAANTRRSFLCLLICCRGRGAPQMAGYGVVAMAIIACGEGSSSPADSSPCSNRSGLGIPAVSPSTAPQWAKLSPRALRFLLQAAARELMPHERVANCLRVPFSSVVNVLYAASQKASMYSGLQTCASPWMCPVCAAKISERRRVELSAGLASWTAQGGSVALLTLTLQHTAADPLSGLLGALKASWTSLTEGRRWQSFKQQYNFAGMVRALEITHGVNGWHPHMHALLFTHAEVPVVELEQDLRARWSAAVAAGGGYASWGHGVDVQTADEDVAGYVSKLGRWSAAHELTKAATKKARRGGRSNMQLLADYAGGDVEAGRLWQEYAAAFKRQRQLTWSRDLRRLLGLIVVEQTDQELVDQVEEDAVILAQLTLAQWRRLLANDARAELLDVAASGDPQQVAAFLVELGIGAYVPSSVGGCHG